MIRLTDPMSSGHELSAPPYVIFGVLFVRKRIPSEMKTMFMLILKGAFENSLHTASESGGIFRKQIQISRLFSENSVSIIDLINLRFKF